SPTTSPILFPYTTLFRSSGNTWLRFLIMEILGGATAEFDNVNRLIPEIGLHGNTPSLLPGGGRLIKTHERYRPEYKRAIYLYRRSEEHTSELQSLAYLVC